MTLMEQKRFMHILMGIGLGYQQFSQIQEKVGGVNNTTLSSRLDKMEEFGVIKRVVKKTKPLEIRYELT
jgi:DNA-binding HxlR family transcriptional regulator